MSDGRIDPLSNDVVIRLRITNKQDYYTSGDTISVEVVVELRTSNATLETLSLILSSTEYFHKHYKRGAFQTRVYAKVDLIHGPVTFEAGCYRFPVTFSPPDQPPTVTEEWGRSYYAIRWALTADVSGSIPEYCAMLGTRQRQIYRMDLVSLSIFPAAWVQQDTMAHPVSLADDLACKRMRVGLCCPTSIPQTPELCDMKVTIDPFVPIYVKSVEVYLEKHLVLWSKYRARPQSVRLPIGHITVEQLVTEKLEFDGVALGWGLKTIQPRPFIYERACLSYQLCLEIHLSRGRPITLRRAFVKVGPIDSLEKGKARRGLPAYCAEVPTNSSAGD